MYAQQQQSVRSKASHITGTFRLRTEKFVSDRHHHSVGGRGQGRAKQACLKAEFRVTGASVGVSVLFLIFFG